MKDIYYGIGNSRLYLFLITDVIFMLLGIFIFLSYNQTLGILITSFSIGSGITLLSILENRVMFNSKDRIKIKR